MKQKPNPSSTSSLFSFSGKSSVDAPLSNRMRPRTLEEYVGQSHILGEGQLLRRAINADKIVSLILYGPPGTGKTTLAHLISQRTAATFERLNAVASNVEDLRRVIAGAQNRRTTTGRKTIVFVDEIHRFNKAQQDVLMPDIEDGNIILIGATVSNPFFSVISPLLSRSMIFELLPLSPTDILTLLQRALNDSERGLGHLSVEASVEALKFLATVCEGDARRALNSLEIGCLTTIASSDGKIHFDLIVAQQSIQKKQVLYDDNGDGHFDTASAFIKSMRGSDPDATLYWLAKMIYAGEDARFIARRICICASEDVGNADPQALVLSNAALQISEFIGLPEARIVLAQAALYVSCAPKSNAVYLGIERALEDVRTKNAQPVPSHLKDASYFGAKKLGHGEGYKYPHDFPDHFITQEYMTTKIQYYFPTDQGYERKIAERFSLLKMKKEQK